MLSGFTGWHLLALLAIVVLIFGATRLPGLAKGLGQSIKIFRNEMKPTDGDASKSDDDGVAKSVTKSDSSTGTTQGTTSGAEPDAKSDKPAA
jgi:sec-independent protein translocase protein TatA